MKIQDRRRADQRWAWDLLRLGGGEGAGGQGSRRQGSRGGRREEGEGGEGGGGGGGRRGRGREGEVGGGVGGVPCRLRILSLSLLTCKWSGQPTPRVTGRKATQEPTPLRLASGPREGWSVAGARSQLLGKGVGRSL